MPPAPTIKMFLYKVSESVDDNKSCSGARSIRSPLLLVVVVLDAILVVVVVVDLKVSRGGK